MTSDSEDLDLAELASAAGVTPRTVRYYVQQGLLPSPGTRGPGTKYDRALIEKLQLIRLLQREHWPLSKIRDHFESLDEEGVRRALGKPPELPLQNISEPALEYVRGVLGREQRRGSPSVKAAASARTLKSAAAPPPDASAPTAEWQVTKSTWERIRLSRDVELSIRRPLTREQNKRVDRLLEAARSILSEED
ncbi:MAG TPA: MerR family transcriptional regulator [Gemmatimonadaceae bacterium]|nr:MerR family transcriptional regulator [Gemmatimonadaceae bacterium]